MHWRGSRRSESLQLKGFLWRLDRGVAAAPPSGPAAVDTEALSVNPRPDAEGQPELTAPPLSAAAKRIVPWLCGTALFMELLDATD